MSRSHLAAMLASLVLTFVVAVPRSSPAQPAADTAIVTASTVPTPRSASARARARARARAQARARARARYRRRLAAYRRMRTRWHRPAPGGVVRRWQRQSPPPLVLRPVQHDGEYVLDPVGEDGGFDADDLEAARKAFTYRDGTSHDVHPRLLELVYRAVRHFNAPYVHVISGYRSTARSTSRHHQGRAVDIVLPGVSNGRLAYFLRKQGFVGVGTYPISGFVHLDVRERSYFWNDRSGPGRRSHSHAVHAAEVYRYDSRARSRGEEPVPDLVLVASDGGVSDAAEAPPELPEVP